MEDYPDQIGEQLQKARESAGWTMEDVHFRTRIPPTVIRALEVGDFSVFSSPAYAKSFLSQYSDYVGVDASLWLEALVPASFISGEFVQPDWMQPEESKDRKERKDEPAEVASSGGGWLAALSLMVMSGVLIFVAFQGYEMLEERLGRDSASTEKKPPPPLETTVAAPAGEVVPVELMSPLDSALATEPSHHIPAGEVTENAPRALIVR